MNVRTAAACSCILMILFAGCSATTRHHVLSVFFDGVPDPNARRDQQAGEPATSTAPQASKRPGLREHGPYAARLCQACHKAGATNALVASADELCFRCHELRVDRPYVHGPVASGGCLVCHDPHSSRFTYLLVSESDTFCLRCHDAAAIAGVAAHAGSESQCTTCHDAHGGDTRYLLK